MKEQANHRRRPVLLTVIAMFAVALTCAFALPSTALADDYVAHSTRMGIVRYATVDEAIEAGLKGLPIYMDADWTVDDIVVTENSSLTIYMYGHTISMTADYGDNEGYKHIFSLENGADLTLYGYADGTKTQITYVGYVGAPKTEIITTTTGGLLTMPSGVHGPLIYGNGDNTVTLDGVTLGGAFTYDNNSYERGGAVSLRKNCTLNMRNGASIEHNLGGKKGYRGPGGGVNVSENVTINMDNAFIHDNYADNYGGGIYADGEDFALYMTNGASIYNNHAGTGGGVYVDTTDFTIRSSDGTGSVSGNSCWNSSRAGLKTRQSGGGIHIDAVSGSNEGLIEGLTIANNSSEYDGGGLELDQRWTIVRNCTITGNTAKYEGGGAYVCNNNVLFDNCTITDNTCNLAGENYEGGGLYVWCDYDVRLSNKCIIKNNTRGKGGSADDVFLRENAGATAKAYITGNLASGSSVGVRTGTTGDRRVAKNFKYASKDCLFADLDQDYFVTYGTDTGGDVWQRKGQKVFTAKINGLGSNKYKSGSTVALSGASGNADRVFWYWDASISTGLTPVSDYINKENAYNSTLTFKMPQNDVDVRATYVDRIKRVLLYIAKPEAGKQLPATATLLRTDSGAGIVREIPLPISWKRLDTKQTVSGKATSGTAYQATISCSALPELGIFFSQKIVTADVTVTSTLTWKDADPAASVQVDSTGSIIITTAEYKTEGEPEAQPETKTGTVKVNLEGKGALDAEGQAEAMALADDEAEDESDGHKALDTVEVTYAYDEETDTVTIAAPHVDGYNFCNWEGEGSDKVDDNQNVTVTVEEAKKIGALTAVYTPVVTKLDVKLNAPVAGKELDPKCYSVKATCSDGGEFDFAEELGEKDGLTVSWTPEAEVADYSTTYTALIDLGPGSGLEDIQDVLADGATVTCNGVEASSAGFVVVDGRLCLALAFQETASLKAASVEQPANVEVSFEDACGYQTEQAAHPDATCWPLPRTLAFTLDNGETVDAVVNWEVPAGLDDKATAAQELEVKGTVTLPDGVEQNDVDLTVSVKVKVAAPESSDDQEKDDDSDKGDADADKDDADKGDSTDSDADTDKGTEPGTTDGSGKSQPTTTVTKTVTKSAAKKGTPSTGDAVSVAAPVALLAIATACLAGARVSRRQR